MKFMTGAIVLSTVMATAGGALAAEVTRHKIPNSDFPIAQAVEIPAGMTTVYVSGALASVSSWSRSISTSLHSLRRACSWASVRRTNPWKANGVPSQVRSLP